MQVRFVRGEQVWAKVDPFPWWPGKIVNIHMQHSQLIYKIRFFNDNSYAYLPQENIATYGGFDRRINGQFDNDYRLQRAVRMADEAFARRCIKDGLSSCVGVLEREKTGVSGEGERVARGVRVITPIISNQKQQPPPSSHKNRQNAGRDEEGEGGREDGLVFSPLFQQQNRSIEQNSSRLQQITRENIVCILNNRREQRKQYDYDNRKKAILRKAELKQMLLERYNLHDLSKWQREERQADTRLRKEGKNRLKIHRKRILGKSLQHLKQKCIKRLYQTCKRTSQSSQQTNFKQLSLGLIARLSHSSQENQLRFQSLFLALLKSLSSQAQPLSDTISAFMACLQRLQNEKPEDEEGSKMTTVSQGQ